MQTMETADNRFQATIPPQPEGPKVQFYVTAVDVLGAESHFPPRGPLSRAMYGVRPPLEHKSVHSGRVLLPHEDTEILHADTNVMSNGRLGATIFYDERQVFYDVGVRLGASGYGRRGPLADFNIRFDPQQLFREVHRTIALDRGAVFSENQSGVYGVPGASPHELMFYQIANRAGDLAAMYDDVTYVDAPRPANTGFSLLKMARSISSRWSTTLLARSMASRKV